MINALKQGNLSAFEQFYTQQSGKVYTYFKRKTASDEDARDLLQTTFLKFWQYRHSLSSEYLPEQHLYHIAKTVFIDYLRKQNKLACAQKTMLATAEQIHAYNPTNTYSLISQLQAALALMPQMRRRIFELNRLQGYSYKEIAELLSISVKAVDNNLVKALHQLRKQFVFFALLIIYCCK